MTSLCVPNSVATVIPVARGKMSPGANVSLGAFLLPDDAIGSTTITLTNVVTGSRYRVERQGDGSLATPTANAEGTAASSTVVITLDYYGGGSANNDLRIKVRKASASPAYKPFETLTTIGATAQSIYIAQIADE